LGKTYCTVTIELFQEFSFTIFSRRERSRPRNKPVPSTNDTVAERASKDDAFDNIIEAFLNRLASQRLMIWSEVGVD